MALYNVFDGSNNLMGSGALSAGTYRISPYGAQLKTPANYTVEYASGTLTAGTPLALTASLGAPVCSGQNGSLTFSASGGSSPYTFTVNGVSATSPFTLSTAGSYKVKVVDAKGCSDSSTLN